MIDAYNSLSLKPLHVFWHRALYNCKLAYVPIYINSTNSVNLNSTSSIVLISHT